MLDFLKNSYEIAYPIEILKESCIFVPNNTIRIFSTWILQNFYVLPSFRTCPKRNCCSLVQAWTHLWPNDHHSLEDQNSPVTSQWSQHNHANRPVLLLLSPCHPELCTATTHGHGSRLICSFWLKATERPTIIAALQQKLQVPSSTVDDAHYHLISPAEPLSAFPSCSNQPASHPSILRQSGSVENVLELLPGWFGRAAEVCCSPRPKTTGGVVAGYDIIRQRSYIDATI
jgi:hypothetical protein